MEFFQYRKRAFFWALRKIVTICFTSNLTATDASFPRSNIRTAAKFAYWAGWWRRVYSALLSIRWIKSISVGGRKMRVLGVLKKIRKRYSENRSILITAYWWAIIWRVADLVFGPADRVTKAALWSRQKPNVDLEIHEG